MTANSQKSALRRWLSTIVFVLGLSTVAVVFRAQLVAWFTGKSLGGATGTGVTAHAGSYTLAASLDPDPPSTQGNALVLELRDASGKPVDDAKVEVLYDMPAMGAMAEMKGNAKIEHQSDGRYRAEFDLPMAGSFTLKTSIAGPAGSASQNFTITVGNKGLTVVGGSAGPSPSASNDAHDDTAMSADHDAIDHYTCSMHPSVKQQGPGKCPICGMDLIPVTKEQQEQGVVMIDEARRQLIGVRTGKVTEAPLSRSFRAVGHVTYDESALTDVNLKVRGWITKLFVNRTGQHVTVGQPLFQFYSPDLYSAEQDFLLATQGGTTAASAGTQPSRLESLARAGRQRLHLLGLSEAQIDAVEKSGTPSESIAVSSPASGFVIEKNVVEGASVDAGMRLYQIAALNKVWVEAEVYEADLAHVRVGQAANVTLDYLPGHSYEAKISYIYPYLDPTARTGRVRVELQNKELELRPGMYASVELASAAEPRVQVPAAAVVYTGPRRLVFVDLGEGRFKPQEVRVGTEANGMYEVLSGVKPGDTVATSGVFLIAAEARISTAAKYWDKAPEGAENEMPAVGAATMPSAMPMNPAPVPKGAAPKVPHAAPAMGRAAPAASSAPPSSATVYTCPMHPEVKSSTPGQCPQCGMNLEPVKGGGAP